jgi:hypothetical protein
MKKKIVCIISSEGKKCIPNPRVETWTVVDDASFYVYMFNNDEHIILIYLKGDNN